MLSSRLVLYIACSLDGYIAEADGSIGFLEENPTPLPDLEYDEFYSSVDTLIMGGKTYRQIVQDLSPDKWLYTGKTTFVYTNSSIKETGEINKATLPPKKLLEQIRQTATSDIWLVGGGEIIKLFMEENLIDRYMIYIMPNLLGSGIPLFPTGFPSCRIHLDSVRKIDKIVEMVYSRCI